MNVPPRTTSAPLGKATFGGTYGHPGISRGPDGAASRVSPPPAINPPLPLARGKVPASLPTPTPPPTAAAAAVAATPASPLVASPASPQPQQGEKKPRALSSLDTVWAEGFRLATDEAGPDVMTWAKSIWETLRLDNSEKPLHLFDRREEVFGGVANLKRHVIIKERTLPHQVMGILSRVTPDNYDAIQEELLNLPIRQSEDAEVAEVISVFFKKAIRPEDSIYAPQYAKLISALVRDIEQKERGKDLPRLVSKTIRSAIVNKCKEQYDNLPELKELQQQSQRTDDPETEARRRELMSKLKANIGFLGQLFVNRLIQERVVVSVLYSLLWGDDQSSISPDKVQDYEIEQFSTLLEVCGPYLTQETKDKYQSYYITTLNDVSTLGSTTRTRVLAMNCKEFIENNYVKRGKKTGPMKLDEYNRQAAEQQVRDLDTVSKQLKLQQQAHQQAQQQQQAAVAAGQQAGTVHTRSALRRPLGGSANAYKPGGQQPILPQVPAAPQPMAEKEFTDKLDVIVDDLIRSENACPVVFPDLKATPHATILAHFIKAFSRFLPTGNKYANHRKACGTVIRAALDSGLLSAVQVHELVKGLAEKCCEEEDVPKIFEWLCEILTGDVFGFPAYNTVLRTVFSRTPACRFNIIARAVTAVIKCAPEPPKGKEMLTASKLSTPIAVIGGAGEFPAVSTSASRVHLLPHVLRFTGYTFAADNEDEEEDEEAVEEREEKDAIDEVQDAYRKATEEAEDIELATFSRLFSSCNLTEEGVEYEGSESKDPTSRIRGLLPDSVQVRDLKVLMVARKVMSAVFTFSRFSRPVLNTLVGVLSSTLEGKDNTYCTGILLEVYETWLELDRVPLTAFESFLEAVLAARPVLANSPAIDTLQKEAARNNDEVYVLNVRQRFPPTVSTGRK